MSSITLTRVSPTVYAFTAQGGDLTARMVKSTDRGRYGQGTWHFTVDVCGGSITSGAASFRDARAAVVATLEAVAPAFAD